MNQFIEIFLSLVRKLVACKVTEFSTYQDYEQSHWATDVERARKQNKIQWVKPGSFGRLREQGWNELALWKFSGIRLTRYTFKMPGLVLAIQKHPK